jgi:hypothetical protein
MSALMVEEQPAEKSVAPHPAFKALLICDHTIREFGTGKVSLIGIFHRIRAQSFPAQHPRLAVYVMVTDAQGEYAVSLQLVRLRDLMTIGRGDARLRVSDRLEPAQWVFELAGLTFEEPGSYEFRVVANGQYLGSQPFRVELEKAPGPEGGAH